MILVTGCAGFIGSHLLRHMERLRVPFVGVDKKVPDKQASGGDFFRGDIEDVGFMRKVILDYKPSVVVNLAARTDIDGKADVSEYSQNYNGLRVILDCLQDNNSDARIIHVSSQLVNRIGHFPQNPKEYNPPNAYGLSKALSEDTLWTHPSIKTGQIKGCIARPTTIWGPNMNPEYLQFFRLLKRGYYVHVTRRERYKSYGYVGNAVAQLYSLTISDVDIIANATVYICDYDPIELYDWVSQISSRLSGSKVRRMPEMISKAIAVAGDQLQAVGFKVPLDSYRLKNMLTEYVVNHMSAKPFLATLPYSYQDGIEETCGWLKSVLN